MVHVFFSKKLRKKKRAMGIPQNRCDWFDSFSKFPTVLLAPAADLAPAAKRPKEKKDIFSPLPYSSGKNIIVWYPFNPTWDLAILDSL